MNKYQLTADELFLLRLIFYAQEEHEEYLYMYFTQNKLTNDIRTILMSLIDKGIINNSYKVPDEGTEFNPQDVDFNKKVIDQLYHHSNDLGMELFNNYPAYTNINGRVFSLKNISKNFKSLDDFTFAYGKAIKFNLKEHQRIMELLEWAKDNSLIHSGLTDFVVSQQWNTLEIMRDENLGELNTSELI